MIVLKKHTIFINHSVLLTSLLSLILISPVNGQIKGIPTGPSVDELGSKIEEILAGRAVGYAYAITKDGKLETSNGFGYSRKPQDGNVKMTANTRISVMSVSKTITSVAVLQLLEKRGLSIYDAVGPWLPPWWVRGKGFENTEGVTFRDLLSHRSGINQTIKKVNTTKCTFKDSGCPDGMSPNAWAGLQILVQNGIDAEFANTGGSYYSSPSYKNANFSLFRIIIPALWWGPSWHQLYNQIHGNVQIPPDTVSSILFEQYLRKNVFEPADIQNAKCYSTEGQNRPMFYDGRYFLASGGQSGTSNSCLLGLGAKGWYLSAVDLAKFLVHIRYPEKIQALYPENPEKIILSTSNKALMDQEKLGWSSGSSQGKFWHGGTYLSGQFSATRVLSPSPLPTFSPVMARREARSCIMKYPKGIEASLVVNSSISERRWGYQYGGETPNLYGSACTVLKNAYDQSVS